MADNTSIDHGLGTLSRLPRELRDDLYREILFLSCDQRNKYSSLEDRVKLGTPRAEDCIYLGLLCTSKALYAEALPILYQINEFQFRIEASPSSDSPTCPDTTTSFVCLKPWHTNKGINLTQPRQNQNMHWPTAAPMAHHIRRIKVWLLVDERKGGLADHYPLRREPYTRPDGSPAERKTAMAALHDCCAILAQCTRIEFLDITMTLSYGWPDPELRFLRPFMRLRECKRVDCSAYWSAVASSVRLDAYVQRVLALPQGTPTPPVDEPFAIWEPFTRMEKHVIDRYELRGMELQPFYGFHAEQ